MPTQDKKEESASTSLVKKDIELLIGKGLKTVNYILFKFCFV